MEPRQFRNIGYLLHQLQPSDLSYTTEKIEKIQKDFENSSSVAYQLIGQIEREFELADDPECVNELYKILMPLVDEFEKSFNYVNDKARILKDKRVNLSLTSLWVNYQKKFEFNPCHNHAGVYSFVIWHKIPYLIEDEAENSPGKHANKNLAGHFEFNFSNSLGQIWQESLPVDKTWENTICLFPAEMIHTVYPFFTSDEYRITIAGNVGLE